MKKTRKEALTDLLAKVESGGGHLVLPDFKDALSTFPKHSAANAWDAYQGSLDAAKALHEAVLPRHYAQIHMWPVPEMSRVDIGGGRTGRDDIPARAWLIAILKALIAQEPDQ